MGRGALKGENPRDKDSRTEVSRLIRQTRQRQKMTQKQFASKLKINYAQLNKYELGINLPSVDTLVEMAKILNQREDYFLVESLTEISDVNFKDFIIKAVSTNKFNRAQKRLIADVVTNCTVDRPYDF